MIKFSNFNRKSCSRTFITVAMATLIFGALANPVLAASGDYYDVTDQIHYSTSTLKSDPTAKSTLKAASKANHVILVEIINGVRLDYNKANNKIAQLFISGTTNPAQILQIILDDGTLKSNEDVSNYKETEFSVISISALEPLPQL